MASIYDRIFADVRKDLPSVVDAVVRQELYRVMDDFTQYTNIWQQEVAIAVQKDVKSYDITSEVTEGKPNRLLFVWDTANPVPQWPQLGILMRVPGIITTYRAPGTNASWKAIIAKRISEPLDTNNYPVVGADEWFVDKYQDTLVRGILARILIEPSKPYTNPMLAQVNQRAYIAGRSLARVNDVYGNVYGMQAWRFPQTFQTRN